MTSPSICSRCLRQALRSTRQPTHANHTPLRTFSTAPILQHSSTKRHIHHASQNRYPAVEPRLQNESLPPYTEVRGRRTDKHSAADGQPNRVLLQPDRLFNSYTDSPAPEIRRRAAFMRQNAYCPHPDHQPTRAAVNPGDPEANKTGAQPPRHVGYECPDCGIPVSCSEEHFVDGYESHLEICDLLRQVNEDDHDLLSGRFFPEFEYPGPQLEEAQVNLTNWDTLLYSREFNAVNEARPMRQVTRLLTYPTTIGSVLHELSPYSLKHRLLPEGLRSFSGMLYFH